ncbi:MAG: universal stress protein [Polyangiales bacterium]
MPRTIVVPTDFTPCSQYAAQYGQLLARRLDARIFLLHSWNQPYSRWDDADDANHVPSKLELLARTRLDTLVTDARSQQTNAEGLFYLGEAAANILQAVHDVNADLIIVGTHGRSGLKRVLEGSVAEYVTRRATCPVLAIRHT